ncbi:hypothetical protein NPIL_410691, partial [Nephila pilipes]
KFWNTDIFSDPSRLNIFGSDGLRGEEKKNTDCETWQRHSMGRQQKELVTCASLMTDILRHNLKFCAQKLN